jgi:hypothetical protein
MNFEDSQIDHFIPFCSPSLLNYQTNRASSKYLKYNEEADIEKQRGLLANLTTSRLIQIPAGKKALSFISLANFFTITQLTFICSRKHS